METVSVFTEHVAGVGKGGSQLRRAISRVQIGIARARENLSSDIVDLLEGLGDIRTDVLLSGSILMIWFHAEEFMRAVGECPQPIRDEALRRREQELRNPFIDD